MDKSGKGSGCFKFLLIAVCVAIGFVFVVRFISGLSEYIPDDVSANSIFSFNEEDDGDDSGENADPENSQTSASENNDTVLSKNAFAFYYDDLSSSQKKIYDSMENAQKSGEFKVKVKNVSASDRDIVGTIYAFYLDHPEFFWIDIGKTEWSRSGGNISISIGKYDYFEYYDIPSAQKQLNSVIDRIVEKAGILSSDYEKSLFVHDEIMRISYYDYDGLSETEKTKHDPVADLIRTSFGTLVNGKCVCMGYAVAYKQILDRLGIPCATVLGTAGTGRDADGHAWNKILLDGEGYYVDVTWDDQEEYGEIVLHSYYNADIVPFEKEHREWNIDEIYCVNDAVCLGTKYSYYRYNNMRLESYDETGLSEIIESQRGNSVIYIQFSSEDDLEKAYSAIQEGIVTVPKLYIMAIGELLILLD